MKNHPGEAVGMDHAIAMRTGHEGIYEGDDLPGAVNRRTGDIYRYAKGTVAMPVGWRYLYDRCVEFQDIVFEKIRYVAQENGNEVGPAFGNGVAYRTGNEQGIDMKTSGVYGFIQFDISFERDRNQLHIAQPVFFFGQFMQKENGCAYTAMYEHPCIALDNG